MAPNKITNTIEAYITEQFRIGVHCREYSWEYCHSFFTHQYHLKMPIYREMASLHLGFYLASWGMFRGKPPLQQRTYTIHYEAIQRLLNPKYSTLLTTDIGKSKSDFDLIPTIISAIEDIQQAYRQHFKPTDTLISKILMGIFGCIPARDEYFKKGVKKEHITCGALDAKFVREMIEFALYNRESLHYLQQKIESKWGYQYPFMKIIDMYFWQLGKES